MNTVQFAIGAMAGMAGTGPMTLVMEGAHRALPQRERSALAPRHITQNLASKLGVRSHLSERQEFALTLAAHFAYGAAAGSVYPAIRKQLKVPEPVGGIVFGLAVWAGSYFGLLPAVGLYPSPQSESSRRNALMILAHVVWGASLGTLASVFANTRGGAFALSRSRRPARQ